MNFVRWVVAIIGWMGFAVLVSILIQETPFFLQPESRNFWRDARSYLQEEDSAKTLEELRAEYGEEIVQEQLVEPVFHNAYLPSEDAAFVNLLSYSRRSQEWSLPLWQVWIFVLVCYYLPMAVGLRQAQWLLSRWVCRTPASRRIRADYFGHVRANSWRTGLLGFLLTFLLCCLNSIVKFTADQGLSWFDMTMALVLLSYLSGLWMMLVSRIVEIGLLVVGHDPDRSLWDDVISVALVSPVLYFVYQNPLNIILISVSAGLAPGLFRKWKQWRTETHWELG